MPFVICSISGTSFKYTLKYLIHCNFYAIINRPILHNYVKVYQRDDFDNLQRVNELTTCCTFFQLNATQE